MVLIYNSTLRLRNTKIAEDGTDIVILRASQLKLLEG